MLVISLFFTVFFYRVAANEESGSDPSQDPVQEADQNSENSENDFSYSKGSLLIRLHDSFLNTLSEDEHTLKVVFPDGEASTIFYVTKRSEKPRYVIPLTGVE